MFYLSSTTPVKRSAKRSNSSRSDLFIRRFLLTIWGLLFIFGILSLIQPKWLQEISSPGRKSEAMDLKFYGDNFLREGKYQSAISIYKKAINTQPDYYDVYGNLAIAYRELGIYQKAEKILNYLLKNDPEHIHTHYYNLAELYKKQNDLEKAIFYYQKSAESDPYPIYSYRLMGELYSKQKKWDLAAEAFNNSLKYELNLENSYFGNLKKIGHLQDNEKLQKAAKDWLGKPLDRSKYDYSIFQKMLSKDREIAKTHYLLGIALLSSGDKQKAGYHWKQALTIWPDFKQAKQNLERLQN